MSHFVKKKTKKTLLVFLACLTTSDDEVSWAPDPHWLKKQKTTFNSKNNQTVGGMLKNIL